MNRELDALLRRLEGYVTMPPASGRSSFLAPPSPDAMRQILRHLVEIGWFAPTYQPGSEREAAQRRYFSQLLWPESYGQWEAECIVAATQAQEQEHE